MKNEKKGDKLKERKKVDKVIKEGICIVTVASFMSAT
jgi:hypothetical protein